MDVKQSVDVTQIFLNAFVGMPGVKTQRQNAVDVKHNANVTPL